MKQKNIFLLASALFLSAFSLQAQQWIGSSTTGDTYRTGDVGIDTSNPQDVLEIGDDISFHNGGVQAIGFKYRHKTNQDLDTQRFGAALRFDPDLGQFSLGVTSSVTAVAPARILVVNGTGRVGIGTAIPDESLTVNGKIHAKEVRVDLNIPADYVFQKYYTGFSVLDPTYTMPSLEEIEEFTKENNHLPGVPSAQEIQEEGLHLKEMTNLLLQKIEELTLYTIEQEKRIAQLEAKLK